MSVGAPPDPLGPHGQDWGLPAFVPDRLAAGGYGPFAQTIRAGMAHAAGLRIDHVMGLFRLFWIPEGAEPAQGTYVRYPADDLLGVLALESHRAAALVVGEDLGTVEPGCASGWPPRRALLPAGLVRARPRRRAPARAADYPGCLAATTTHDLPTVAGFFTGSDLEHLCDIGLATPGGEAQADQETQRASLCRLLEDEACWRRASGRSRRSWPPCTASSPGPRPCWSRPPSRTRSSRPTGPTFPAPSTSARTGRCPCPSRSTMAADPRVRRLAAILEQGVRD